MLLMSSFRPKTGEHSGHEGLKLGFKLISSKKFVDMISVFDPGFGTYSCEIVSFLNHPEVIELYILS